MNETLAETIPEVIATILSGVHTAIPGKIEKYDRSTFRADVTPLLKRLTRKNEEIDVPTISDIPVLVFGGSSGIIDIELSKGDNVLLIIMETGIGGWKSSSGDKQVPPDDLSQHEITNAVAIPCLVPDGLVNSFSNAPRITIDKDGTITATNDSGNFKLSSTGTVSLNDHFTVDP